MLMQTPEHKLPVVASIIMLAGAFLMPDTAAADSAAPEADVIEVRRNVSDTLKATESMLATLGALNGLNGTCPPELLTQFATNAHRLQVDSFMLRARVRAMQLRGDVYFQQWQERFAGAQDPAVRHSANEHRQGLEHSFGTIRDRSKENREAFERFMSDIQTLRRALESNPSSNVTNFTQELIQARNDGQKVRQSLTRIREEWDAVTSDLTPAASPQR
jgi:hypothetical protein